MPRVLAENIKKSYDRIQALKGVTLDVQDGEYLSIVGPSGCGKTTLIKSMAGIVKPDAGKIIINNIDVTDLPIEDRGLGYVFQEIALFPHMTISDNVGFGPMVHGDSFEERRSHVKQMLSMMNLEEYESFLPAELSGGARQKTAIARALATGSSLLLLDEPLGMLDLKVRTALRYELQKLVKDLKLTAIHVTHDQEEALSISDRVVVMRAGEIIEIGTPENLYLQPKHLFTAKFLGEANFLEGTVKEAGDKYTVDVSGSEIKAQHSESKLDSGARCVLVIRPEFITLKAGTVTKTNTWRGRIRSSGFLGDVLRYEVEADNGVIFIVKVPFKSDENELKLKETVTITLPEEHLLIYLHPGGDLEKELSLE
jgi:putative spermidine/putrescine transport system ATP-binding protein